MHLNEDKSCPECGSLCPNCAAPVQSKFCPECGVNIEQFAKQAKKPRKEAKKNKKARKEIERITGSKVAQCTNDLTGFLYLFPDGVAQNDDDTFSMTMEFGDISYENERDDVRNDIYDKFCALHSTFQPPMSYQINLVNFPVRIAAAKRYLPETGKAADVARAWNEIVEDRQRLGRTLFERRNFLSFAVPGENRDIANGRLVSAAESAASHFQAIKCPARVLDGYERARVMHDILRGSKEPFFLSYERIRAKRASARECVAPSWAVYEGDEARLKRTITLPNRYVRSYIIRDFGSDLSDRAIRLIRGLPIPMVISLQFEPQPRQKIIERVNANIDVVQGQIFDLQSKIVKNGGDPTVLPPAVEDKETEARELRSFIIDEDQDESWFQGIITVFADEKEELAVYEDMLLDHAAVFSIDIWNVPLYQEEALCAVMPLARDRVPLNEAHRSLCTAERAIMMPFNSINISNDPSKSYYMGVEKVTRADIFIDPDSLMSPHAWVFGPTGSGKSMQLKAMLDYHMCQHPHKVLAEDVFDEQVVDSSAPQWFIYDFHNEYGDIADRYDGRSYVFGPGHESCLNPLDFTNAEGTLEAQDIHKNIDFFLALIEATMGRPMSQREKSELDECLIKTYEPFIGTEYRPTLVQLHDALRNGGNAVSGEIADSIKMYVTGTMSSFAKQTNVYTDPWLNRYNMAELGDTMQTIGMLSTLQHVRMQTYKNNRNGRATYLLIEEVQKLFANNAAVRVFLSFFAELRKYGLHIICVTQLPKAVLEHPMASDLFDNSSLFVFLPQQEQEAGIIKDLFKLSAMQADYITSTADKGTGLIIADGVKIGFDNRVPKDSLIYKLNNTDGGSKAVNAA